MVIWSCVWDGVKIYHKINLLTKNLYGHISQHVSVAVLQFQSTVYIFLSSKTQLNTNVSALLRRCYSCRSRGDLGTCKDPFTLNLTLAEQERGVEAVPCASGWCGKFLEGGNSFKDDGEIHIKVQTELSADTFSNSLLSSLWEPTCTYKVWEKSSLDDAIWHF